MGTENATASHVLATRAVPHQGGLPPGRACPERSEGPRGCRRPGGHAYACQCRTSDERAVKDSWRPRAALFLHALPVMSTAFPSVALALFAYAFISNVALAVVPHEPAIVWAGARLGIWTTAVIATAGTVLASWVDHLVFVLLLVPLFPTLRMLLWTRHDVK